MSEDASTNKFAGVATHSGFKKTGRSNFQPAQIEFSLAQNPSCYVLKEIRTSARLAKNPGLRW
jgi:hypothetical protein